MAELFINQLRDALKNYHKNVLISDYNYLTNSGTDPIDNDFYEALAWQGLKNEKVETEAYNKLSDIKKQSLKTSLEKYYPKTTANCPNN